MLQLVTLKHEASGGHLVVANYHMPCMCGTPQPLLACHAHARCRFLYPEVAAYASCAPVFECAASRSLCRS